MTEPFARTFARHVSADPIASESQKSANAFEVTSVNPTVVTTALNKNIRVPFQINMTRPYAPNTSLYGKN